MKQEDEDKAYQQLMRGLNALICTEQQQTALYNTLKNKQPLAPKYDGFFLKRNIIKYRIPNTTKTLELVRTPTKKNSILKNIYDAHGIGKGTINFYKFVSRHFLGITRKETTAFLQNQPSYVISRKPPARSNRLIIAKEPNELWAIDLVDFYYTDDNTIRHRNSEENRERAIPIRSYYRYVMTVVDVFSRKLWLEALTFKETEVNTKAALQKIIE